MPRNKIEDADFAKIGKDLGIKASEVRRAVYSFFGVIVRESRNLPFDDESRIYTKDKFEQIVSVRNIPFIGRIGPVYSRYLKWRGNVAKNKTQVNRSSCRSRVSQSEIEAMAADILSGKAPTPVVKPKLTESYKRIWMIGRVGKRLARQVIPKEQENGIQD